MSLLQEEDSGGGVPEWIVTFGDMMSLLLTFFIMLVSMSEIKQEEKYQAMVDSIIRRFGYDTSVASLAPGTSQPRSTRIAQVANDGRARRLNLMQGGDKVQAATGDFPRVRIIRPGERTNIGAVIFFDEASAELDERAQYDLQQLALSLRGKPQKIEVRGHTSQRPIPVGSPWRSHSELAYQRSWHTVRYLVDQLGIEEPRLRISIAGPYEPLHITPDQVSQTRNPRVEVFMLDEVVTDLMGTQEEQNQRYTDGDIP
ncbi:MAG: OmpA family protein [Pirellulaceae bacterium]|jgi:chemotaxis protein MotB|nr:OmpA family protein [Pirellulaceae bacterium]